MKSPNSPNAKTSFGEKSLNFVNAHFLFTFLVMSLSWSISNRWGQPIRGKDLFFSAVYGFVFAAVLCGIELEDARALKRAREE
jgi:hypothetical protein